MIKISIRRTLREFKGPDRFRKCLLMKSNEGFVKVMKIAVADRKAEGIFRQVAVPKGCSITQEQRDMTAWLAGL